MSTLDQQQFVDYHDYITLQLERTRRHIRSTDLMTAIAGGVGIILTYLLTFVVLDHWVIEGGFSTTARVVMLISVLLLTAGWFVWRVSRPAFNEINSLFAAKTLDTAKPDLHNVLLTLIDIRRNNKTVSPEIEQSLEKRAALGISKLQIDQTIDHTSLMRSLYFLLAIVVIFALYALLSPKQIAATLLRAVAPSANIAAATRTQINNVLPGKDIEIPARSQLEVSAFITGDIPEEVLLKYTTADRRYVDEAIAMKPVEGDAAGKYAAILAGENGRGLLQNHSYYIEAGDDRTTVYHVTVKATPVAKVDQVFLVPPTYTGSPPVTQETGNIDALEGTRVAISATVSMPVKLARIRFSDTEDIIQKAEEVMMTVSEGTKLTAELAPLKFRTDGTFPQFYHIECKAEDDAMDPAPVLYRFNIRPDQPPMVRLRSPQGDLTQPANGIIPLVVEAQDPDFRLHSLTLHVEKGGERIHSEPLYEKKVPAARVKYDWKLEPMHLLDGDEIAFWVEARDNKEPVSNLTNTQKIRVKIRAPQDDAQVQKTLEEQKQEQRKQEEKAKQEAQKNGEQQPPGNEEQTQNGDGSGQKSDSKEQSNGQNGESQKNGEGESQSQQKDGTSGQNSEMTESKEGEGKQSGEPTAKGEKQQDGMQPPNDGKKQEGTQPQAGKKQSGQNGTDQNQTPENGQNESGNRPADQPKYDTDGADDDLVLNELLKEQQRKQQEEEQQKNGAGEQMNEGDPSQPENKPEDKPENSKGNSNGGDSKESSEKTPEDQKPSEAGDEMSDEKGNSDDTTGSPSGDSPEKNKGKPGEDMKSGQDQKPGEKNNSDQEKKPGEESQKPGEQKPQENQEGNGTQKGDQKASGGDQNSSKEKQEGNQSGQKSDSNSNSDPSSSQNSNAGDSKEKMSEQKPGESSSGGKSSDKGEGTSPDPNAPMEKNSATPEKDAVGTPAKDPNQDSMPAQENVKREEGTEPTTRPQDPNEQNRKSENQAEGSKNDSPEKASGQKAGDEMKEGQQENAASQEAGKKAGSESKPGESKTGEQSPAGKPQPGEQQNSDSNKKPSEQGQPSKEGEPGKQEESKDGMQQPGQKKQGQEKSAESGGKSDQPGNQSGSGPSGENKPSDQPGSQAPGKPGEANPDGRPQGAQKSGGGGVKPEEGQRKQGQPGAGEGAAPSQTPNLETLEDRKKAADLVLKELEEDLKRGDVDDEFLKRLGWTESDLKKFRDRMSKLSQEKESLTPEEIARRKQYQEMLKNLNLNTNRPTNRTSEGFGKTEVDTFAPSTIPAPAQYQELERAYKESLSKKKN